MWVRFPKKGAKSTFMLKIFATSISKVLNSIDWSLILKYWLPEA